MYAVGYAYRDRIATTVPHIWVVFAAPNTEPDERAIVSVTSDGPHISDRSCAFGSGDHQSIKHLSYALYRKARIITVNDLTAWLANSYASATTPMAPDVIDRIRSGALQSPFTPRDVQAAVRSCKWVIPKTT